MIKYTFWLVVISLLFIGCKGDTGPTGPSGNANVSVYTFSFNTYSFTGSDSIWNYTTNLVLFGHNGGAVVTYIKAHDGSTWFSLPLENPVMNLSVFSSFDDFYYSIHLRSANGNAKQKLIDMFSGATEFDIRVVAIPPAMAGKKDLKLKDY